MKKKLIIALFAITACGVNMAHAQLREIPAEITNSFTNKFPGATNVEWLDQLVNFEVTFDENNKKYKVKFTNEGAWESTERIIKIDYLPDTVRKGFFKSEYAKWEIKEVTSLETPENKNRYKITVAKNNVNKKDLLFNIEGRLVKENFIF